MATAMVVSLLSATSLPSRAAAATAKPAKPTCSAERPDAAAAAVTARLCNKRIRVTDGTTETDQVFVNPDGTTSVEHYFRPVRVQRSGAWVGVDATLARAADGSIAPKAAAVDLKLSGGGNAPLITSTVDGVTLALGSPVANLPAPSLSGNTATYADVLPGVDLQVIADIDGFAEHLVVKNRQAAAQPALKTLRFATTTTGGAVKTTDTDGVQVVNAKGQPAFAASTAEMWDDTEATTPNRLKAARNAGQAAPNVSRGRRAAMGIKQTSGAIEVTPDQAMLADPATTFPVTIDPGFTAYKYGWNYVDSAYPNNSYYNVSDYASVGTYDSGTTKRRSFWNMNLEPMGQYKQVLSAVFHINETWSWSCSARAVELHRTAWVGSNVTWNTQPASNWYVDSRNVAKGYSSSCPAGDVNWDVTNAVQDNQNNGYTAITFMLKASNETDNYAWKKFDNNPHIDITYNTPPTVIGQSTSPSTTCASGAGRPYIRSATPLLSLAAADNDGNNLTTTFQWWVTGGAQIGSATATGAAGSTVTVAVPAGALSNGGTYSWRALVSDGYYTTYSSWCEFTVDTVEPNVAPGVSSTTYQENAWGGSATTAGSFTFTASGVADVASYQYGLDSNPPTTVVNAPSVGANATVNITPGSDGPHTLYVRSQDRAGNQSPIKAYQFQVGIGGVTSPKAGDISAGQTSITAVGQPSGTGVTYEWRRGDTDAWATIPAADVTVAAGGGAVTWPLPNPGNGNYPKLNWNVENTLAAVDAQRIPRDGPLQLRATFSGSLAGSSSAVKFTFDRNRASAASANVGPGSVNLATGNFTLSVVDTSIDSYGSDLTVSRTFNTRRSGETDSTGMFGPGWTSGVVVTATQAPYTNLTALGSLVQVGLPDGTTIGFTKSAVTTSGATFDAELGMAGFQLSYASASDSYTLHDLLGNTVTFTHLATAAAGSYQPTAVTSPGTGQVTTYGWEKATVDGKEVVRPTQVLAPIANGVACGTLARGCRALTMTYATATTATGSQFGDYTGRVTAVGFTAWDPDAAAMRTVTVARYAYDSTGRLRQVWDPRLDYTDAGTTKHVATTYSYDADGVLTTITPAGQESWKLSYTTLPADPGKGRLAAVTRSALSAGIAVTTVVYTVPTAGTGAPYDLSPTTTARWGQAEAPTTATAIFGPDQVPTGNQSLGQLPTSYERANITYLDANAREADHAAPGGYLDATWYDANGDVVRTLTASNRATALASSTNATSQAAAAERLSTVNTYSSDGQRLLETLAPEQDTTLANGSIIRARTHTVNTYDEGAPNTGGPFNLITTARTSARYLNGNGVQVDTDTRTTKTTYDWTLRKTTSVTQDAGGLNLTERTSYDPITGLVTATTLPSGGTSTTTPATRQVIYYRAGTGSGYAECDNHPEWANLPCRRQPGGQASSGPELPVTTLTYDMYNNPRVVTEKTSAGALRTSTTTYDAAGRASVVMTTAPGLGTDVSASRTVYDAATGLATAVQSLDAGGNVTAQTTTVYDTLGRITSYTDSDGVTTTTSYDIMSRPLVISDGKGTRTLSYDGGSERRGLLTQVDDSQAGTFTASYDAAGNPVTETWPNGIVLTRGYNETGLKTGMAYTRPGCGSSDCTLYADYAGYNTFGQRRWDNTTLSSQGYGYDNADRLTITTDTRDGSCTSRAYGFDSNTNRTVLNTFGPAADGSCQMSTQSASRSWTYDAADRTTTGGYAYDKLGRVVTLPASDTQNPTAGDVGLTYYSNDLVSTITQNGRTTRYTLDVDNQRIRNWSDSATGLLHTNHYSGQGSDSPAWTAEGSDQYSRLISSATSIAAIYTSADNTVSWQITNLHGDIVANVKGADAGLSSTSEADEYGQPRNAADVGSQRYSWLGAKEREADAPAGLILMGVRLYNPATGRFLQVDPLYGGSCNAYDYTCGDPINRFDLDGRWSFKRFWHQYGSSISLGLGIAALVFTGPFTGPAIGILCVAAAVTSVIVDVQDHASKAQIAWDASEGLIGLGSIVAGIRAGAMSRQATKIATESFGKRGVKAAVSSAKRSAAISRRVGRTADNIGKAQFFRDVYSWYNNPDDVISQNGRVHFV